MWSDRKADEVGLPQPPSVALQVGTASLPLRGLLRQGRPSTELLLRVPVADPHRAIARLDASGNAPQLCCSPIRGSLIVRLACAGTRLDLQAACASQLPAGSCSWPASPLKQQGTSDGTVVVRAKPALEEGGPLARELARLEGVSCATLNIAAEVSHVEGATCASSFKPSWQAALLANAAHEARCAAMLPT